MIDFSTLPQKKKLYTGANGSKRCVVYNGDMYMVKFPPYTAINKIKSKGTLTSFVAVNVP